MERWIPYTRERIETPEDVPRLFDLVQVRDERVLPAFYFSLQNTLVAGDLHQATRIGLQGRTRYKVVTLKGELIEVSGTMSGGGGKPMRGRMGQSIAASDVNPEEVEAMVRKVQEMTGKVEEVRRRDEELFGQVGREQRELTALKNNLPLHKMKSQSLKDQATQLTKQLEDQKARVKASAVDHTKKSQLQTAIDAAKKDYASASGAAKKVQDKVAVLHKKIMEITEGKMGAAQKKVDTLNGQIDNVASTITKNGVTIKTTQRNAKKCQEKIASLEKEIQQTGESRVVAGLHSLNTKFYEVII